MGVTVKNKICVFKEMEFRYHLSGEIPSAVPGGGRIYLDDPAGRAFDIVLPDAVGSVQTIAATSPPRTLPVGDHLAVLTIEEARKHAVQPVDLVLDTEPRITVPDPSPCIYMGNDITPEPPLFDFVDDCDIYNRTHLCDLARILYNIGIDWHNAKEFALRLPRVNNEYAIDGQATNPLFGSGTMVFNKRRRTIVWIYGTTTNGQLAQQADMMRRGPIDLAKFSVGDLWWEGAQRVLNDVRFFSTVPTDGYLFVGHSMGGAVASMCAAMVKLESPSKNVELVTFGSPKPGDAKFKFFLSENFPRRLHIENAFDIIPYTCFDFGQEPHNLFHPTWFNAISGAVLKNTHKWDTYHDWWLLDTDGKLIYKGIKANVGELIDGAFKLFIENEPIPVTEMHIMKQYLFRLLMRKVDPIQ